MLDEIAEGLPIEFYNELNGGILLIPESKLSPYAQNNDLWIMGEYIHSSFIAVVLLVFKVIEIGRASCRERV